MNGTKLNLKAFYIKESINKTKRQTTEQEKIFTKDIPNKELTFKLHKQLMQLNNNGNQFKNGQKI